MSLFDFVFRFVLLFLFLFVFFANNESLYAIYFLSNDVCFTSKGHSVLMKWLFIIHTYVVYFRHLDV